MLNLPVYPWDPRLLSANNANEKLRTLPLAETRDFVAYFRQGTDSDLDTQPVTEPGKGTLFRSYTICYILKGITQ